MLRCLKLVLFLPATALAAGCSVQSSLMTKTAASMALAAPTSDKAVVVFLRPSNLGGAIQASVFDVSRGAPSFIGIVSAGTKLAYATAPGLRRFMVIGESADFMDALSSRRASPITPS
jgi:hypothetical protein